MNLLTQETRPNPNAAHFKGVHRNGKKWIAKIQIQRKRFHLGCFDTPEEAYSAYCEATKRLNGEFAHLG